MKKDIIAHPDKPALPIIKNIKPGKQDFTVSVTWANGQQSIVDLFGLIHSYKSLASLRNRAAFRKFRTVYKGHSVRWGKDIDIGAETIARIAQDQVTMTPAGFAAWQNSMNLSLAEAAEALDLSLAMVKRYKQSGTKIPRSIQIACRAIERDPTILHALYHPRIHHRAKKKAA
ncbi:MAG: DUF2442 domain-containing protein [Alphaproteobacteria bacterium]